VEPHEAHTPARSPAQQLPARVPRRKVGPVPPTNSRPISQKGSWRGNRSWDKLLILVGVAALVGAVLVVPGIVQPGGKNPVAAAAEATANVPGVRMTFTMSAQGSVPFSMSGTGVMNGEAKQGEFQFSAHGASPSGVRDLTIKEIVDDLDVYMNMGDFTASLGSTKPWILIRADAFAGMLGGDSSGLGAGMNASPQQQLESLESASESVAEVGPEQVGGVATTHYTAVIDMDKALGEIRDRADKLGELLTKSMEGVANPTVDVWIDGQGLLRRETSVMSLPQLGSVSMAMDFTDYGIRPQIEVPPESEVYDMTPMFERLLDSGALGA
jgi:hypothetical protein